MQTGPIPAEIAIVVDYAQANSFNIREVTEKLSRLGIVSTSCFIISLLDSPPPSTDGEPDIDNFISKRKTCPGPGWVHFLNKYWISPELIKGYNHVLDTLEQVNPKLVIGLGKAPLVMFTGQDKLASWRGSRLNPRSLKCNFLPTYHPRVLKKQPDQRFILDNDLTRAFNIYTGKQTPRVYNFAIQPLFSTVIECLSYLLEQADKHLEQGKLFKLSGDLETRAGHIACFGIAWSAEEALCIPHLVVNDTNPFYWSVEEEAIIVSMYGQLFHHPAIQWIGQNFSYDCQYFRRHWGMFPVNVRDTMINHHALHSNIRKGLDFLSSLYAQDHIYWKDEIKEWDPKIGEKQYWEYNCKDACITYEIDEVLVEEHAARTGTAAGHLEFQQSMFFPVFRMMNRGINYDVNKCKEHKSKLTEIAFDRQQQLNWLVGHDLNPKSPTQLIKFFYTDLGIPGVKSLNGESLTTNSPTLAMIAEKHPLLKPLCQLIVELRSLGVFLSTFIDASLDADGRMRSDFAIAGPTTYRFASRENAFNAGMNFQNIPVKEKQKIKDDNYVKLPNIRELFLPDQGKTFFDIDLDRADMQVVGWEADDANLKMVLRKGIDLHCMSAAEIYGIKGIPVDELAESHPNYLEHRARIGKAYRDKTKNGGHACDYAVGDRKLAQTLGITTHEASAFKARWFGLFPGIRKWHLRVEQAVLSQGFIENKFGARLYCFGRFNLPEFLGWLPQSTVAGVINRALVNIDSEQQSGKTSIELLIQVHDSLAGQFSTNRKEAEIANLKRLASITVPYDDPLIIPVGVKTSTKSWGACE